MAAAMEWCAGAGLGASEEVEESEQWRGATSLSLRGRKATCIPPSLFHPSLGLAASLQTLDLGKNELAALPPATGELVALTALDVSRNFLKRLPPALGLGALAGLGENGVNRSDNDNNEEPVPGAGMPVMTGIPVIAGMPVIPYMPVMPELSANLAHSVNRSRTCNKR